VLCGHVCEANVLDVRRLLFFGCAHPLLHPFERADYSNPSRSQVGRTIY
jgi:hypothetical protein